MGEVALPHEKGSRRLPRSCRVPGDTDRGVGFIHNNRVMRCYQQEMEYADNCETFGVARQWHSHQGTRGMTFQLFPALIVT